MTRVSWLGLGFIGFGLFVLAIAIPFAVTSPSNVQNIVLSPTFWPTIIAWLIIGLGGLLTAMRYVGAIGDASDDDGGAGGMTAWLRVGGVIAVMAALVLLTPVLGLVWTAMLSFGALSVLVRSSRPVLSAVVAVLLPLALYAFFNHVAGVAVPQGEFIRLP